MVECYAGIYCISYPVSMKDISLDISDVWYGIVHIQYTVQTNAQLCRWKSELLYVWSMDRIASHIELIVFHHCYGRFYRYRALSPVDDFSVFSITSLDSRYDINWTLSTIFPPSLVTPIGVRKVSIKSFTTWRRIRKSVFRAVAWNNIV